MKSFKFPFLEMGEPQRVGSKSPSPLGRQQQRAYFTGGSFVYCYVRATSRAQQNMGLSIIAFQSRELMDGFIFTECGRHQVDNPKSKNILD